VHVFGFASSAEIFNQRRPGNYLPLPPRGVHP